jgi:hypothetical protein
VSADSNSVVVVDLETGSSTGHDWTNATGLWGRIRFGMAAARAKGIDTGSRREAFLAEDGTSLFIATATSEMSGGTGDRWTATSRAEDLLVVDMTTWVATALDAPAWHLAPSPDGTRIIATAAVITSQSSGKSTVDAGPVHVVDTATAEVIGEFQATTGLLANVQWSPDRDVFYMVTSGDQETIDIVDLAFGQVVGSVAFREISLIGEAGLMAFHLDSG